MQGMSGTHTLQGLQVGAIFFPLLHQYFIGFWAFFYFPLSSEIAKGGSFDLGAGASAGMKEHLRSLFGRSWSFSI